MKLHQKSTDAVPMNSLFSTTYKQIKTKLGVKPFHVIIENMSKLRFDLLAGC